MVTRLAIRFGTSLVGIAAGILLCSAVLSGFSIDATAVIEATLLFWVIHLGVQFLALRVLVRQPSVALAGLLALASTVAALLVVNIIVSGLSIHRASTYVLATLIIWITMSAGDIVGRNMIRDQRQERRASR